VKSNWARTIVPGLLLGFTVARLGFADFGELHRMLLFRDLRLLLAFATAAGLSIALFALLRGRLRLGNVPFRTGTIPGAVLFGIGWAVTGTCPGVAVVQLGQGIWTAAATLAGILAGVWIHDRVWPKTGAPTTGC
jgi:hypothetical protein